MESTVKMTPEPDYGFAATLPLTEEVDKDALAKAIISSQDEVLREPDEDFDNSASEFTDYIPEAEISSCEFLKESVVYYD
jgi:hypothetical protein